MVQRIIGVHHFARRIGDATFAEHQRHLLAAAVAQVGQMLDQFHRGFPDRVEAALIASITLKPSRSPSTRTSPKLAFKTAS